MRSGPELTEDEAKPERPAVIKAGHIRDRLFSHKAGAKQGWRNIDNPMEHAHENGRLKGPRDSHTHNGWLRWMVFTDYRQRYETALCPPTRDSTALDIVSGGSGIPVSEAMNTAIKELISIDSHMSKKDRLIVRKLCANCSLPEAIDAACGDEFKHTVGARVRDALDALIDAVGEARACGFKYVRMAGS